MMLGESTMTDDNFDFLGQAYWRKCIHQLKQEFKADTTRTTRRPISAPLTYGSQKHTHPEKDKSNPKALQPALKPDLSSHTQSG